MLSLGTLRRGISALDDAVSAVHAGDKTSALADLASARPDFGTRRDSSMHGGQIRRNSCRSFVSTSSLYVPRHRWVVK